jgi:hypothetical protein
VAECVPALRLKLAGLFDDPTAEYDADQRCYNIRWVKLLHELKPRFGAFAAVL